jgi:HK97 family phage major capsid protein
MMVNHSELKQLIEQRATAHAAAVTAINSNDKGTFTKAMADVKSLGDRINEMQGKGRFDYATRGAFDAKHEFAFNRYIRGGREELTDAERRTLERRDVNEGAPMLSHIGTYSSLGYLVPTGFTAKIEDATKYFCPMLDSDVSGVTVLTTDTGNPLPMPTSNDTNQVATIVGEAAPVNEEDITASQVDFASYKFSSGVVKASVELLQDSGIDIESWLSQRFGIRFGRGIEQYLTTGNGSGQPTGLLTAIEASGVSQIVSVGSSANDGVGAKNNTIGSIDLVNLEHGVDPSYRRGARYMLHDLTLASLQSLLDKYGRPLWTPGLAENVPDKINGYPYVINQSMPAIGSGVSGGDITMIFGDFSKYIVRKVRDLYVKRLDELFAVNGQVGFISFARLDANLLDAGTHPLNILVQHS